MVCFVGQSTEGDESVCIVRVSVKMRELPSVFCREGMKLYRVSRLVVGFVASFPVRGLLGYVFKGCMVFGSSAECSLSTLVVDLGR